MTCPKCNKEIVWGYTWIEHQGIGHPGPQTWICECGYVEPIVPVIVGTTIWTNTQEVK